MSPCERSEQSPAATAFTAAATAFLLVTSLPLAGSHLERMAVSMDEE